MSEDRIIPSPEIPDVVTFTVIIDGEEVGKDINILSVNVLKEINKIPYAKIIIKDGSASLEDFIISNSETFVPGKEIEIQAGYRAEESVIFKGIIIKHGIKKSKFGPSLLEIECKDKAIKLTATRKNRFFYDKTDSDALGEIVDEYGLTNDIDTTDTTHGRLIQNFVTDWDFILTRAEVNGLLVMADDGDLYVKKPKVSEKAVLSVTYGANIYDFEAEIDSRYQYPSVSAVTWDSASQENLETDAKDPESPDQGNISSDDLSQVLEAEKNLYQHSGQLKETELQSWADSIMLRSRLARIRGWVSFMGFASIKPGNVIELNGLGKRFNGNAFVSGVKHEITGGNWVTKVQIGLDPRCFSRKNNDIADIPASGVIPHINGLVIGKVTQLQDDPDGEDRVKVKIPVLGPDEEGIWARVACLDAGNERGTFFRPEIDDEVVLGFLNDDPRDPVLLGQLNSSAKPAPLSASDENPEKGYVSREKLKQIFNDEVKSIEISTPNGNKIIMTEEDGSITIEDENSNIMVMNSDGISMESPGDISIKASGDVTIEGTNITVTATAQFKAEGSGGSEVSSGATTIIKGSLVQIN